VVVVVSGTVVVVVFGTEVVVVVEVEVDVELEEVVVVSSTEVVSELPPQKDISKRSIKYLFIYLSSLKMKFTIGNIIFFFKAYCVTTIFRASRNFVF
jgi:hypothetical protein